MPNKSDKVIPKVLHMVQLLLPQLRPSTVSFLCEGEPPHPISTPWGAYRMHIIPPLTITARYQFYTLVR